MTTQNTNTNTNTANGILNMMRHKLTQKTINEYKDHCGFKKITNVEFLELMLQDETYITDFIIDSKWINYKSKMALMYKFGLY